MITFDMTQTADLLESLRGTRVLIPVMLGALCGLRRGEIAALRWRHVDFGTGKLSVVESAEQTVAATKIGARTSHSTFRDSEYRTWRASAPPSGGAAPTWHSSIGRHVRLYTRGRRADAAPQLDSRVGTALSRTTLPRIRFHDLRHAHATHLLSNGVHPKVASERLGHSRVGITLDLYSHVLPGMQEDAAARVDDALRQAVEKRATKGIG